MQAHVRRAGAKKIARWLANAQFGDDYGSYRRVVAISGVICGTARQICTARACRGGALGTAADHLTAMPGAASRLRRNLAKGAVVDDAIAHDQSAGAKRRPRARELPRRDRARTNRAPRVPDQWPGNSYLQAVSNPAC